MQATMPDAGPSYWCVPMDTAGDLTRPDAVTQLLSIGRFQLAARSERPAGE
ncbi:hypothetical protein ABT124_51790 [Streptomyces sp. NPDC001982]|uniref:hypothetical protein n=1 Tax=Streptomyces sp. NPDC001982 TaxID=3154405 RepID=UPI00331AFBAD